MAIENQTPAVVTLTMTPTFELRRFAWGTPDRLEVVRDVRRIARLARGATPVLV